MKQKTGCIYAIQNLKNDRIYIGKTTQLNRRFKDHKKMLETKSHTNKDLQYDYNVYGKQNFKYFILEQDVVETNLLAREDYWIEYYGGIESDKTYNMMNSKHMNSEVKQFIGESNTGKIRSEAYRKLSSQNKKEFYNENTDVIGKISKSVKSYYKTEAGEEAKKRASEYAKLNYKGENNPMFGKHHTKESKLKMSNSSLGKTPWNKGKKGLQKASAETKEKLRKASTKYNVDFINVLKISYKELGSYSEVAKKYKLNAQCVSRLIRYGSTKIPRANCND